MKFFKADTIISDTNHRLEHTKELLIKYPDLEVIFDENGSIGYISKLINQIVIEVKIEKIKISNNFIMCICSFYFGFNEECTDCNKIEKFNSSKFEIIDYDLVISASNINNNVLLINILSYSTLNDEKYIVPNISLFDYEFAIKQNNINPEMIRKIELWILEFIKNNKVENFQLNEKIKTLINFI